MKCVNGFRPDGIAVSQMLVEFFLLTGKQASGGFRNWLLMQSVLALKAGAEVLVAIEASASP
tara:strand:- start:299 stop:484 length:186 start_codon:yes stop_codon:yes gene_type:complete